MTSKGVAKKKGEAETEEEGQKKTKAKKVDVRREEASRQVISYASYMSTLN
jgi:hypothetical protein